MTIIIVMSFRTGHELIYAPEAMDHVHGIARKYHRLIEKTIHEQLAQNPFNRTRNRKPLENIPGPFGATWELRFGPDNRFRVFYEAGDGKLVLVLAIGEKDGNRLYFAGKEFKP